MPRNRLVLGEDFEFYDLDNSLLSVTFVRGIDVVGVNLSIDVSTALVKYPYTKDSAEIIGGPDFDGILSSDGYLMATNRQYPDLGDLPVGTVALFYRGDDLYFKMYLQEAIMTGLGQYELKLMSAIGLLENQDHAGGFYDGAIFTDALADIIGGAVPYTVAQDVAALRVRGYLPYQSKRLNLHWLTMAYGVMIGRNDDGNMHFKFLSNATVTPVPGERFYDGGSVSYTAAADAVDVIEHSYMALATDETVTEYDNTDGSETANNTLLIFQNAPLHDLQTTGTLTIVSSGVNWAVISGTGILTGKKYTHSTRLLTKYADETTPSRGTVAQEKENTLVNVTNSENVAKRILAYYSSKKTVKTSFVDDGKNPGDLLSGIDPYGDSLSGFLASMQGVVSGKIKVNSTLISSYVPTGQGANYTDYHLYTGSGTITWAPLLEGKSDDDPVQISLIQGGHGGYSGSNGTSGTNGGSGTSPRWGTPGDGGDGGQPGEGGKVLTFTTTAGALRALVSSAYFCGAGGASDADGGATTLLGRSSSEGATTPYGVANIFTGDVYGAPGIEPGQPGGAGSGKDSAGPNVTFGGVTWTPGSNGASSSHGYYSGYGGYGGGAAVGSNGDNGADSANGRGGVGGNGAPGRAGDPATQYGCGGNGGHGGGGAGIGGLTVDTGSIGGTWYTAASNGTGGERGPGGKGGNGLILIYT